MTISPQDKKDHDIQRQNCLDIANYIQCIGCFMFLLAVVRRLLILRRLKMKTLLTQPLRGKTMVNSSFLPQKQNNLEFVTYFHLMFLVYLMIKVIGPISEVVYNSIYKDSTQRTNMTALIFNSLDQLAQHQLYFAILSSISYQWFLICHNNAHPGQPMPKFILILLLSVNGSFLLANIIVKCISNESDSQLMVMQQLQCWQIVFTFVVLCHSAIKLIRLSEQVRSLFLKIVVILLTMVIEALLLLVNSLLLAHTHDGVSDYILGYPHPRKALLIWYYVMQELLFDLVPPIMLFFIVRPDQFRPSSVAQVENRVCTQEGRRQYSIESGVSQEAEQSSPGNSNFSYLDRSGF